MKNNIIEVQNVKVNVTNMNDNDYICISDFTKFKEGKNKEERFKILSHIGKFQLKQLIIMEMLIY